MNLTDSQKNAVQKLNNQISKLKEDNESIRTQLKTLRKKTFNNSDSLR
jgi:ribosomal protein S20